MQFGRLHHKARPLRVPLWIDGAGAAMAPLTLEDMGPGYKVIFCFQHWCPGCHSRGFPALAQLHARLAERGFGFAAIQTVFEGAETNTFDMLRLNQQRHGLPIPFGHDLPPEGERYPSFMGDYRTAGTPWFTVIDPAGIVVHADFRLDPARFLAALERDTLEMKRR